jgi:hypothetical protein
MPGYVVVISPDSAGVPQGKTYFLGEDAQILAVVALLEAPKAKQVRVVQDGLHVRGGPGEEFRLLRSLRVGDTLPVYEIAKDPHGNEWVRISQNEWICRVYNGVEKAVFI